MSRRMRWSVGQPSPSIEQVIMGEIQAVEAVGNSLDDMVEVSSLNRQGWRWNIFTLASAYSTALLSTRSLLFPISTTFASLGAECLAMSSHCFTFVNESWFVISYTTITPPAPRQYDESVLRKLSCPELWDAIEKERGMTR